MKGLFINGHFIGGSAINGFIWLRAIRLHFGLHKEILKTYW
jgi:hypothetical protein